jgi:tRNA acetyltransferase TAN1
MYGDKLNGGGAGDEDDDEADGGDIESAIQAEVAGIHKPSNVQLFTHVRVDVQCGMPSARANGRHGC